MDQLGQLKDHHDEIKKMAEKKKVPIFKSIQEATDYIFKMYMSAVS